MESFVNSQKPVIIRQRTVTHPSLNKPIGEIGWDTSREETVFVSERYRDSSLYESTPNGKSGGYAISESVLTELRGLGVERVYVAEYETGDVYQFSLQQYKNGMRLTHHRNDPQRCVSVDERENGYQNYLDNLYQGDE